jgi:hypothetical protein
VTDLPTLLSTYFAAVDDKRLDAAVVAATFTADGTIRRPDGTLLSGHEAILTGQNESFARFRATHHMLTDPVVEITGDNARVRTNMQAMHLWHEAHRDPLELVTHFLAGGVLTAVATRLGDSGSTGHSGGWRLTEMAMRPVWRTGSGLGLVARAGR